MLVGLLGFGFGIYQYRVQQGENQEQERESRDREFMKPLWEKQLATYFEASEAASTIAMTTDGGERTKAINKFWMLYQGPLVIVESPAVSGAMQDFGNALSGKTKGDLRDLSKKLASAFQESLIEGANLRLDKFREGKFDYRSK